MGWLRRVCLTALLIVMSAAPSPSQALPLGFDTEILLLLAGPVSEAVQETILLVRRGENFVSKDSLGIGCVAGASAGFIVGVAPYLGFIESSAIVAAAPISGAYLIGTMLLSCTMTIISSAAGMGTVWGLRKWRKWRDVPLAEILPPNEPKNSVPHPR